MPSTPYVDANVTLPVRDLHRSVVFYTDALGLSLRLLVGREWAEVQGPGLTIGLEAGVEPDAPTQGYAVAFEVDDLEQAVARLERHGVRFADPPSETARARQQRFSDPDGNRLCLREAKRLTSYAGCGER